VYEIGRLRKILPIRRAGDHTALLQGIINRRLVFDTETLNLVYEIGRLRKILPIRRAGDHTALLQGIINRRPLLLRL